MDDSDAPPWQPGNRHLTPSSGYLWNSEELRSQSNTIHPIAASTRDPDPLTDSFLLSANSNTTSSVYFNPSTLHHPRAVMENEVTMSDIDFSEDEEDVPASSSIVGNDQQQSTSFFNALLAQPSDLNGTVGFAGDYLHADNKPPSFMSLMGDAGNDQYANHTMFSSFQSNPNTFFGSGGHQTLAPRRGNIFVFGSDQAGQDKGTCLINNNQSTINTTIPMFGHGNDYGMEYNAVTQVERRHTPQQVVPNYGDHMSITSHANMTLTQGVVGATRHHILDNVPSIAESTPYAVYNQRERMPGNFSSNMAPSQVILNSRSHTTTKPRYKLGDRRVLGPVGTGLDITSRESNQHTIRNHQDHMSSVYGHKGAGDDRRPFGELSRSSTSEPRTGHLQQASPLGELRTASASAEYTNMIAGSGQQPDNIVSFDDPQAHMSVDPNYWPAQFPNNLPGYMFTISRDASAAKSSTNGSFETGVLEPEALQGNPRKVHNDANDENWIREEAASWDTFQNVDLNSDHEPQITKDKIKLSKALKKWIREENRRSGETFVLPDLDPRHESYERKYLFDVVYAYHPPNVKNYYFRDHRNQCVCLMADANTLTRTFEKSGDVFPTPLDDIYPVDWNTNVDVNIKDSLNPDKQKVLNDLRNAFCSAAKYVNRTQKQVPWMIFHDKKVEFTTTDIAIAALIPPATRESIKQIVRRISNSIFTGAKYGGSFRLYLPRRHRGHDHRWQRTYLSNEERSDTFGLIRKFLHERLKLPNQPTEELKETYRMFVECNLSSETNVQSPYLHKKLTRFRKFPQLPPEIRQMIWEFCFPIRTELLDLVVKMIDGGCKDQRVELPNTLRVCRESRYMTNLRYKRILKPVLSQGSRSTYGDQISYDNRKKKWSRPREVCIGPHDTLAISEFAPQSKNGENLKWLDSMNKKLPGLLEGIRHLEVRDVHKLAGDLPAPIPFPANSSSFVTMAFTKGILGKFKNLQTLTLTNVEPGARGRPYNDEEKAVLKDMISDYLNKAKGDEAKLLAKVKIEHRDYVEMEGRQVEKDNGRQNLEDEFFSKMITHIDDRY
ncbi:hypothetical protein SBOR_1828 [Sclerotinia borealis F-4128]|uniref:2EXR domain-containing protein n=1 Tax=Sclerotinia borealis (strain F-4128) TaxID=1432307 RepID=W9CTE3_SCLBF|nr:hypothetical protein SBOR_1828 [Sclerotinia borealis F-4128]